jgi:hypothetical protein
MKVGSVAWSLIHSLSVAISNILYYTVHEIEESRTNADPQNGIWIFFDDVPTAKSMQKAFNTAIELCGDVKPLF